MIKIRLLIVLLLSALQMTAADRKFPVHEIPDSLLTNAHAVMRMDEIRFLLNSTKSTTWQRHYAVTILNGKGEEQADFSVGYDRLRKISNIEGYLYDAAGNMIRKLKSKDINDISGVSDNNLMDDNRIKTHNFHHVGYPYTVEYFYEVNVSHTFYFDPWMPISAEYLAIQNSSLSVSYPAGYQLRHHAINLKQQPQITTKNGIETCTWAIKNIPAITIPGAFASWRNVVPVVMLAPSEFQLDGVAGNMTTWKEFGNFLQLLNRNRHTLPENIRLKVRELTADAGSDLQKIKALYRFMQGTTRYISVQLGVGGWVPFDAEYVATRGYGDCKALTNYMRSLLMEAGIKSYYTVVHAGDDALSQNWVIPAFSSNQFNHAILCVPLGKDTVWLECTNQYLPAGYVSSFTANRKALMIADDGGYLVSTPTYGLAENSQTRHISAAIHESGEADIHMQTRYGGLKQDFLFSLIKNYPPQKVKEYLSRSINLPTFNLGNFTYEMQETSLPALNETLDITAQSYAIISGKRLFIVPNIVSKYPRNLMMENGRKVDFYFETEYRDIDSIEITLPAGYKLEAPLKSMELKTDFGFYKVHCSLQDNKIVYQRVFEQFKAQVPANEQKQVIDFYQAVYKSDRARLVFVKAD